MRNLRLVNQNADFGAQLGIDAITSTVIVPPVGIIAKIQALPVNQKYMLAGGAAVAIYMLLKYKKIIK